ncbi:hypothetical protein RFF05_00475 [Bengtsoniella intestinalis]|uniref:hypothetical protein n=1 Tax=Bengtsoniella intestinalis TaxID=3073143 RepID=UPI00391FC8DD
MEVFTRNFLQAFEAEKASFLNGEFDEPDDLADIHPPSIDAILNYHAVDTAQYRRVPNDEKLMVFRALYGPLEIFADATVADLRIEYDEDIAKGEIQLKYQRLDSTMCPRNDWHIFLSLLFRMYEDFSISPVDADCVLLKFFVDLADEVQVADYSKQLEILKEVIALSKELHDFDL